MREGFVFRLRTIVSTTVCCVAIGGLWACSSESGGGGDSGSVADSSEATAPVDAGGDEAAPDVVADLSDLAGIGDVTDQMETPEVLDQASPDVVDLLEDLDPVEVVGLGGRCVSLRLGGGWLTAKGTEGFEFAPDAQGAARFYLQAADLDTYLLYDAEEYYLLAEDGPLQRSKTLQSDVTMHQDRYVSGGEWVFEQYATNSGYFQLKHNRSGLYLAHNGLSGSAGAVTLEPAEGCSVYPEMALNASGAPAKTTFEDGHLFGVVDAHTHIMSNLSFGGGLFHGAPFHRLGVTHALPDCSVVHGEEGKRDFFGHVYDSSGSDVVDFEGLIEALIMGELPEHNHVTAGWPEFTEWPNARERTTHQASYYRWLERAWLAGLRLTVHFATNDWVICTLMDGEGVQPGKYDCEDMVAVDRTLEESWAMQRYIDAQWGGEGKGWFRIVLTPEEAREVIKQGKLAVILGIETSNLFNCHLTRRPGMPECDEAYIDSQLTEYYNRGVRAIFPVHKYDNRFSPGDGSRDFLELGAFVNSGHWTNMTMDCPDEPTMPKAWDQGRVFFGGLLQPRDEYLSDAPNDMSKVSIEPVKTLFKYLDQLTAPPAEGPYCQNATITKYGEALLKGMMERGMIIETDHFPQWSYQRIYEILEENDYPAAGTHGRHWDGRIYALGGISTIGLGRCQNPDDPGGTLRGLHERVELIESKGGYPAAGFGFDYNGFAGAPGPRFKEGACGIPQQNPITYPFTSYAGDVEFTQPYLGNRMVDFNTEGMIHIGLLPELIQDARADAGDDAALEPLFRSAEAYVRMWEKARTRAEEIKNQ